MGSDTLGPDAAVNSGSNLEHNLAACMKRAANADSAEQLQREKNIFALNWCAASHLQTLPFAKLGALQSGFAALTIDRALTLAWREVIKRFRLKNIDSEKSGLFVLGLGKLGGQDLNFSSDVDLIGFYDADSLPVPESLGQAHICGKVLQAMTQILSPRNGPDFIWRVDWRLRPESSGTGLAISTSNAEIFYFTRALPWHRLALMKARVIAGDIETGSAFLKTLIPFIWRQNLDFRAIDDLADLKTRINQEHPGLRLERAKPKPIMPDISGFNVKLGQGGIREIEFIANGQQLIWGGKEYSLRTPNTLLALAQLSERGHMSANDTASLSKHYQALRRLENAIQMIANEQTHIVPDTDEKVSAICALLGIDNWHEYQQHIYDLRLQINARFTQLFAARADHSPISSTPHTPTPLILEKLNTQSTLIAQSWANGFDNHGLRPSGLASFRGFGRALIERVISAKADPNNAFARVDIFLQNLSRSEQYLHLLKRNPSLLDALITPILYAPHMTELLSQSPHIIDVFLSAQSYVNRGEKAHVVDTYFVMAEDDYETRLERLRRFVNEHLFQYYHEFMRGVDTLEVLQTNLTELAQMTIETSLKIAMDDLGVASLPLSVLGLGKMGTQRMAPMSDIDLIFIFDDTVDTDVSAKIVRRLRTILTAKLREGIAYDLDMRLRPSGRSGPPAVKLSAFIKHHQERAKSWEHIALAHGRVVAGDRDLGLRVERARTQILSQKRDHDQFKTDAAHMWSRIETQRIETVAPDIINAKLRSGGLMQAEYLDACQIILGQSQTSQAAIDFFSHQQVWERLLSLNGATLSDIPAPFKEAVFSGQSQEAYHKLLSSHQTHTCETFNTLLAGIPIPEGYTEAPILWTQ